jgi:hypothetical protein
VVSGLLETLRCGFGFESPRFPRFVADQRLVHRHTSAERYLSSSAHNRPAPAAVAWAAIGRCAGDRGRGYGVR